MASIQGWGRQTWNSGAWNTFAPVEATGNGLTSTVGTVSLVTTNIFGVTGNQLTSSIGDATQASEYAATGNAVTSSLGTMPNPTIVDNQLLTGWNRGVGTSLPLGWNAASWGNGDFILSVGNGLSGAAMTSSLGEESPTAGASVTVTGLGTTSSVGTATAIGNQITTPNGNVITSSLGTETVTGSSTHTLTGIGLTSQIGDEDAQGVRQSGWNRGANQVTGELIGWGDNLWNILETSYSLTGVQNTLNTGSLIYTGDVAPTITGVSATLTPGQVGGFAEAGSLGLTSSIGTFSISGDSQLTIVAASEPELDISIGTAFVEIGKTAFPTTNLITSSLGTEVVSGDCNVTATGNNLASGLGNESVRIDVELVGVGGLSTKTVTVVSTGYGNKYAIDGVQQDALELVEGNTYKFDQSDNSNSGHPLRFSTTSDGTHAGGSEYTTGVTISGTPGQAGAYTQIAVASGAPTLYYYCSVHSGMGGQASTPAPGVDNNTFTANGLNIGVTGVAPGAGAGVSPTGVAITSGIGDATQSSEYEAPSVALTASEGTLQIRTDVSFTITGVSATSTTGNLQGVFWKQVDDSNSAISWTIVHEAA
jgi:hypothetical protein